MSDVSGLCTRLREQHAWSLEPWSRVPPFDGPDLLREAADLIEALDARCTRLIEAADHAVEQSLIDTAGYVAVQAENAALRSQIAELTSAARSGASSGLSDETEQ